MVLPNASAASDIAAKVAASRLKRPVESVVCSAHAREVGVLEDERRINPEVGLGAVSFGKEEVERIGFSVFQAEAVEFDGLIDLGVDATDVDDKFAVDENPDVVVAVEREDLIRSGDVGELGLEFVGEVEVVIGRSAGVTEELPINREELGVLVGVNRLLTGASRSRQRDLQLLRDVGGGGIAVPRGE